MKHYLMHTKLTLALFLAAFAVTTYAQSPDAGAGVVVTSQPGKAAVARVVEISAQVVSINKVTRTVTLKGPQGNVVDVVAGDEVKNFSQIKLGDFVVVRYAEALTLELRKTKDASGSVTVNTGAARAMPGERPAVAGAGEVTAIATVTAVDKKKSTITLKGPMGNLVMLPVQNPDQFKVVKKGDQVEVTYTEALALSVEPGSKPKAEKQK